MGLHISRISRLGFGLLAFGLAIAIGEMPSVRAQSPQGVPSQAGTRVAMPSFAPIVKAVLPAVVNVSATQQPASGQGRSSQGGSQRQTAPLQPNPDESQSPLDELLRRYFEEQGRGNIRPNRPIMALGSGFIIDPQGYVVTNNHVVENADKITVIFQDDSQHPATLIGRDVLSDLALLKIDAARPLPFVAWGDSDALEVGDWVVAVGNAFGLGGTVSPGVVSARHRDIQAGPYDDFLQIDASINRGDSGGPTFDLDGRVIGINTAIYSPNGGSVGIGFAIPATLARPIVEQLKAHGKVERGWLGVQIQEVTPEIASSLRLQKPAGALVADVTEGGPAQRAGIQAGDVILSFDGHDIATERDLPILVANTSIGRSAPVKLWRKGKETTITVAIAEMPANPSTNETNQ